jgi:hypothetical protein
MGSNKEYGGEGESFDEERADGKMGDLRKKPFYKQTWFLWSESVWNLPFKRDILLTQVGVSSGRCGDPSCVCRHHSLLETRPSRSREELREHDG